MALEYNILLKKIALKIGVILLSYWF